jgi:hypothetical protein
VYITGVLDVSPSPDHTTKTVPVPGTLCSPPYRTLDAGHGPGIRPFYTTLSFVFSPFVWIGSPLELVGWFAFRVPT